MNYEKKYKEGLERAKKELQACGSTDCDAYRQIIRLFPELKESEDERIRKDIISYIKAIANNENISPDSKKECKTWLAWLEKQNSNVDNANKEYWRGYREGKQEILDKYAELEKQGEQKPADKVEPKFKVGDWVVIKQ